MGLHRPPAARQGGGWTWELPDCFAFLRGRRVHGREPPAVGRPPAPKHLPELGPFGRRVAKRHCGLALTRRRLIVAWQLLPVVARCALDALRPKGRRRVADNTRRLRLAFEALGPAFVKLGQALAAREDVLSPEVAAELRKLCDQVPPFPRADAERLLAEELGDGAPADLGEVVAAASLGQVYRIEIDGKAYAMKVQRPGLAEALAIDLVILKGIAKLLRGLLSHFWAASVDVVHVTEEWATVLWRELDYMAEARSMENMRAALCGEIPGFVIPGVCWRLTALRVLTSEWVDGDRVTNDPKCVTATHIRTGVEAFAAMILTVGVVHADPHPGNMLITHSGSELCLLDFGMVIHIPASHRGAWARAVVHLVLQEHDAVLDDLIELGFFPPDCPRDEIIPVMSKIWVQLVQCGSDIRKRKVAVQLLYQEIMTFVRRFQFDLPDYYVALARALITLEGIALAANCDFDIFEAMFPVALKYMSSSGAALSKSVTWNTADICKTLLALNTQATVAIGKTLIKTTASYCVNKHRIATLAMTAAVVVGATVVANSADWSCR